MSDLRKKYKLEENHGTIWCIVRKTNKKKETLKIQLEQNKGNKLVETWYKQGYIKKPLNSYITCRTYVEDGDKCMEKYNPLSKNGKINFDWLLENTKANRQKIINECIRRFEKE